MYHYKDIFFANPVFSKIPSRRGLSVSTELCGRKFLSPAIPANMVCSISFEKAKELSELGYFYILHRFYEYDQILEWIENNQNLSLISISIGANEKDYNLLDKIKEKNLRVDYITIDIAHGHCLKMKHIVSFIKNTFGDKIKIIAGNIITSSAVKDFKDWGVDIAKVGIAQGGACSTYNKTGVGLPQFSAVLSCARDNVLPVIADGGIREIGDYSKALVAGATMVMSGSEFVKCVDSPAETYSHKNGGLPNKKIYFGSASSVNKGSDDYSEGFDEIILDCNNLTYTEYYEKIKQGIQSCMSYHNIIDITKMKNIKYSII